MQVAAGVGGSYFKTLMSLRVGMGNEAVRILVSYFQTDIGWLSRARKSFYLW